MKPRTAHGQHTLPGEYFTSADIWREEQARVFQNHWLLAGHVSALHYAGDYLTVDVAGEQRLGES